VALIIRLSKQNVDPVERDRPAADYEASRDRSPQNIRPGKLPNREQRSQYRYQDARTRYPKRHASDETRIQKATPGSALF
jgi:hypothetical protein